MLELDYTPHAIARQLATRHTLAVGLILTNVVNDFFAPLLNGIEAVTSENGYNLLVAISTPAMRNRKAPSPLGPHNTDGTLVFSNSLSEEQLVKLIKSEFPVVLIHRTSPINLKIPFVTVENKEATRKIIDHLIENHGRRRILFMQGPQNQEDSDLRESGYRVSLAAHGFPIDESLILRGEFEHAVAYKILRERLSKGDAKFDAVFAGDDDAAVGVLVALKEAGIRVPEDVSVAGFDDSRLSPLLNPPLSTVRAPTEEVGRAAAQKLFNLIQGWPIQPETLLPTEIILRRSCGCVHASSSLLNLPGPHEQEALT
jgi:DNA-binding LacI/PurR family transcriptional regulator